MDVLVPLSLRSSHESVPRGFANFAIETLVAASADGAERGAADRWKERVKTACTEARKTARAGAGIPRRCSVDTPIATLSMALDNPKRDSSPAGSVLTACEGLSRAIPVIRREASASACPETRGTRALGGQ